MKLNRVAVALFAAMVMAAPASAQLPPGPPQIPFGTTAGTAAQGNDSRIIGAVQANGGAADNTTVGGNKLSATLAGIPLLALPGITNNVQGSGVAGMTGPWIILQQNTASPAFAPFRVQRNDNYQGSSGLTFADWTTCTTVAGEGGYIYCKLNQFDNFAGSGTNMVADYDQAKQEAAAGPTWAHVNEVRSYSQDPTFQALGEEVDVFGHLTDANGNRVGIDVVGGYIPGSSDTTPPTITYGVRVGAQNGTAANANFGYGYFVNPATYGTLLGVKTGATFTTAGVDLSAATCGSGALSFKSIGFSVGCTGAITGSTLSLNGAGVEASFAGTGAVGADFSGGSFSAGAIRFKAGQTFCWEGTSTVCSQWSGSYLQSLYGAQLMYRADQYGNFTVGSGLIVPGAMRVSSAPGLSAAGTNQGSATVLSKDWNEVTGGTGGVIATAYNTTLGGVQRQEIINASGATINIYPPLGAAIWPLNGASAAGAVNNPITLANGSHATIECKSATLCYEAP